MSDSEQFDKCGECAFWKQDPPGKLLNQKIVGTCFGLPPQVVPMGDQSGQIVGGVHIRPHPPIDDPACSLYMNADELDDGDEAANDTH